MWNSAFPRGRGHTLYRSKEVKRNYADRLLGLSEKCFWAIIAPILLMPISNKENAVVLFVVITGLLFSGGIYFRHEGLLIHDELNAGRDGGDESATSGEVS